MQIIGAMLQRHMIGVAMAIRTSRMHAKSLEFRADGADINELNPQGN